MSYSVVVTTPAEADLAGIGDYIAFQLKEPETALCLLTKIENKIMELKDFPTRCALIREEEFRIQGYRKIFVENYTIFLHFQKRKKSSIFIVLYTIREIGWKSFKNRYHFPLIEHGYTENMACYVPYISFFVGLAADNAIGIADFCFQAHGVAHSSTSKY